MKIEKVAIFIGLFLFLIISGIPAQEVSEKKDVSVFNISYYGLKFPEQVLGSLDSTIRKVFVDMGRFRVLEVRKRFLSDEDLYEFIERIKEIKEQEVEISDEVSFGHVIFTEADFNALISSFIVIIPEVVFFDINERYNSDDEFIGYEVSLRTSFTVLDASNMEIVAKPEVETSGFSEDRQEAWLSAIDSVPSRLEFELKSIPIFTLKTGVLSVQGGTVTLEKGNNMGIYTGFEFEIIRHDVLPSGFKKEKHVGLVMVKSVFEEISEATVLYGKPVEGDQLVEIPRMGGEGILYFHTLVDMFSDPNYIVLSFLPGIQVRLTRGLYFIKPFVGFEIPLADLTTAGAYGYTEILSYFGFPMNFLIGADLNFYMGRLQVAPTAALGLGLLIPYSEDDEAALSHAGFKTYLSLNYLISRDLKLTLDLGYSLWFPLYLDVYKPYGGILAGLEIVWKS